MIQSTGTYICEFCVRKTKASNNLFGQSENLAFHLSSDEPKVNAEKSWVHSAPGIKTALKCWVVSEPKSKVEWLLNGELFKSSPTRVMHQTNGDQHILSFNQVTTEDFGNYTCRASNNLGSAEDYIQLSGKRGLCVSQTRLATVLSIMCALMESQDLND